MNFLPSDPQVNHLVIEVLLYNVQSVLTLLISLCCSLLLFCSLLHIHLNCFFSVLKDLHIVLIGRNAAYLKICVYERGRGEHKPDEAREGT